MIVHPEQAAIVNRVFRLFIDGQGLKAIAKILNEDGIPAPNDGGQGNKHGTGWGTRRFARCFAMSDTSVG